jgi:hypothetical protein
MRRILPIAALLAASCGAHAQKAPPEVEGASCIDSAEPPKHTTLTVHLVEPSGRVPRGAEVRVDPCCKNDGGSCRASPIDGEGRVVLDACPDQRAHDVIVSVETNPRFYIYTPPRAVRVCSASTDVTITIDPHPKPPG